MRKEFWPVGPVDPAVLLAALAVPAAAAAQPLAPTTGSTTTVAATADEGRGPVRWRLVMAAPAAIPAAGAVARRR
jgi:hypothetical protein